MTGQKTKLMQRDSYALLKATELAAEMLADYERAMDGGCEMRIEATTEPIWDDIVIHHPARTDKWQVKRQTTDFKLADAEKLIRAAIPLRPSSAPSAPPTHHHFGFTELVAIGTGKEKLCTCVELRELCEASRVPNLDVEAFAAENNNDAAFKFIQRTLSPTITNEAIVRALQHLHVHRLGTEGELRTKAASHLREFLENADDVVTQLHAWFGQNPNGLIQIDSHLLHERVIERHGRRYPSKGRWVHLSRRGTTNWETRGPLPVDKVVDGAWGSTENVRIDVGSKPYANDSVSSSLSRLLVHRTRSADACAADPKEWQSAAHAACGGTLGISTDALPLACNAAPPAHPHPPRLDLTSVELAERLKNAMDSRLWSEFVEAVQMQLHETRFATDVREAAISLWDAWQNGLTTRELRAGFIHSMLATAEESSRGGLDVSVRSGRLLIAELARATIVGLTIACGLAAVGRSASLAFACGEQTQNLSVDGHAAHLIALQFASHPRDRKPCRIDEDPVHVLADERGTAILAAVGTGAAELYGLARDGALSLAAGAGTSAGMTHRGPPTPVLTASPALLHAMTVSRTAVGKHVAAILDGMAAEVQRQLEAVVAEAVANG